MTTTTPALSAAQLGRHIGQTVQVDAPGEAGHGKRGTLVSIDSTGSVAPAVLFPAGVFTRGPRRVHFDLEQIRPVLRLVTDATDAEWRGFFGDEVFIFGNEDYVTFRERDGDEPYLSIWNDGEICSHELLPMSDLIDYLDSLGIDSRGLIQKGLAVRAENNEKG